MPASLILMGNMKINENLRLTLRTVAYDDVEVGEMIRRLDQYQIGLYGKENCNLDSVSRLKDSGALLLGAFAGDMLAGIGAVKLFDGYAEIKRMYTGEGFRGLGAARLVLNGLEEYARENGKKRVCLETGYLHDAALTFYTKAGYGVIERFGNYKPNTVSIYFEKFI